MDELLKIESQLKSVLAMMEQEETVLNNRLDAIRVKINNQKDELNEIFKEKERIMIEEDTYFDDKIGIEIDGTRFVLVEQKPSILLSEDLCEAMLENYGYDITFDDVSSQLAYRFIEATKKWVATKAPNPRRLLIPKVVLIKMAEAGHVTFKMK